MGQAEATARATASIVARPVTDRSTAQGLCLPMSRETYRIAVRHALDGHGGSAEARRDQHGGIHIGALLQAEDGAPGSCVGAPEPEQPGAGGVSGG